MSSCRQAVRGLKACTRQVPKIEASVILVLVPAAERVPPPADYHRSQAALGGGVVRRDFRFSHKEEEFLDVVLRVGTAWLGGPMGHPGRYGRGPAGAVPGPVGRCAVAALAVAGLKDG